MEHGGILEQLKDKCILITGATGFLAKIFVEKVLRVQPNVKKLFLLVRASDATSAMQRVQNEVIDKELFNLLREKHGKEFRSFITEKLAPVFGDIGLEDLGIVDSELKQELFEKTDIILNVAANTNFYERYDVALKINALGAKHVLEFAKRCTKLQIFLHVSTAFVAREQEGMIVEKPLLMGETLKGNWCLSIDEELKLVEEAKIELRTKNLTHEVEKSSMKELGLKRARNFGWPNTYVFTKAMGEMILGHQRGSMPLVIVRPTVITSVQREPIPGWIEGTRTIDSVIVGYAKGKLPCFYADIESIMDVIPGDMVVNAMIAAMVLHANQQSQFIYHICSSKQNPMKNTILEQSIYTYFQENPLIEEDGKEIQRPQILVFKTKASFHGYMALRYGLPLEAFKIVNMLLCRFFSQKYNELNRKHKFLMRLVDLYGPYLFFKGRYPSIINLFTLCICNSILNF